MANILTYGTFDLLHRGHIIILKRAAALGENLFVGVSSDIFNNHKGKNANQNQEVRRQSVEQLPYVTKTFWEHRMDQKINDVLRYNIDIFVMGDDWIGAFDHLRRYCEVVYLPRTPGISSTMIRNQMAISL